MHVLTDAIVLGARGHGEHGAIVRAMTPADGMLAGYVRGGQSRRLRPILVPGNIVRAEYRARVDTQLPAMTAELVHSRAPLLSEPLPAAAIEWSTALAAAVLPEGQSDPAMFDALSGLLGAVEAAPSARGWAAALVRFELLLLTALGVGLDLTRCVVTERADDLAFVSPKSARAVSRSAAAGHEARLLPLPAFLLSGSAGTLDEAIGGLRLTRHFLDRELGEARRGAVLAARDRLDDRLARAAGVH
ncbi:DNA repair protein RecO (recombination protein O) [Sphingomonas jejuensis]|uniref:DNA repair protein RecO n=1 Tax=Sphingomonas jejuensis TaxID=904715 RepID=A0ABX0XI52_9SPHN|nr:DNA repair protein RecO [Sphingomonas jejuensis]NJC33018.1 DNA repair protein RecO (recombination protein O) [Sphingomonas jejuensis]